MRKHVGTFRKSEFLRFLSTESDLNVHGNTSESRFCLVSVDVSFRKQVFFPCSSLFIGLLQHSFFLIFLCHYRTGKCVVVVLFFNPHHIYAPLCEITHIKERFFLHSLNESIYLFSFSSLLVL